MPRVPPGGSSHTQLTSKPSGCGFSVWAEFLGLPDPRFGALRRSALCDISERMAKLSVNMAFRIDDEVYARVERAAAADERTVSSWARRAIARQLEADEALRPPDLRTPKMKPGGEK